MPPRTQTIRKKCQFAGCRRFAINEISVPEDQRVVWCPDHLSPQQRANPPQQPPPRPRRQAAPAQEGEGRRRRRVRCRTQGCRGFAENVEGGSGLCAYCTQRPVQNVFPRPDHCGICYEEQNAHMVELRPCNHWACKSCEDVLYRNRHATCPWCRVALAPKIVAQRPVNEERLKAMKNNINRDLNKTKRLLGDLTRHLGLVGTNILALRALDGRGSENVRRKIAAIAELVPHLFTALQNAAENAQAV